MFNNRHCSRFDNIHSSLWFTDVLQPPLFTLRQSPLIIVVYRCFTTALFTLRHSSLIIVVYRCFTTAIVHASTLFTHHCGLPMFYNRHCSRFNTLHSWLWFTAVLQPPLFTLQHYPLMIVVYRCFTSPILHASTLSTHHCGLPMFYNRHCSRFDNIHSSLWFTDVYNRHCSRFDTLHSWLWSTDVLQPPLFTLRQSPLIIVVYRCFTTAIVHASTLFTHHCGLPMFYNRHCSRFDTLHSSLWFTDVLQPPLFTLRLSSPMIVVYRCFITASVQASALSTHDCGLPMFYNRHCSRFNTLHSWLWSTDVLQPPLFTLQHSPLIIVVYRCFTTATVHASTLSTHDCGLPMFYNRHCSRFDNLHSSLWFTDVLQPPLLTLRHSPLIIVVYRCFTTAIVHASTLSTHDCGLPMLYNRHCLRFNTLHSLLWFTDVLQPPLFTLRQSPLSSVVYRCFTTAIVHVSTLSTHDCGLPMFYNRHCSRFDTLHSSLWSTDVLQPLLFTLLQSPLMIVVYRCFTTAIVHASTLSTHHCGLPMFYNRHCSRFYNLHSWLWFTDVLQPPLFTLRHSPLIIVVYRCFTTAIVHASTLSTHDCGLPMFYNRHCSRFDTLLSWLWSTDVLQPPLFTLRQSPLIIVVYRCFTTAIAHASTLSSRDCGLPMFYNRHCSRFSTLHSWLWFTDVLQPPLLTLRHSPLMIVVYRCFTTAIVHASTLSTHDCGLPMFYNRHCSRFNTLHSWLWFTDVLQPPLFTLRHSPLMIVVYRCFTTAIVHPSTISTHHCGVPMFYNRHCSRFDTLHSSLWFTFVLQPPLFTLRHSPLMIVVYRCFTTAIVHASTFSTHHCGLPMFYNRHCSRFYTLHSSLWFTDVLQPPLFTLQHSPLMIVVYRCFTTAIVHASTLSTHDCGLPMFYNRHCSRFDNLHSSLWFIDVLQQHLFTLRHSSLIIVVYRCFTTAIVHHSTLFTHHCGLPMFYNRHCSRFYNLHSWLWFTDVLQPPLFTLQHYPLMIVVYRCFTSAILHASTLSTHHCGLPMFYNRHCSRFDTLHSWLWFTDVLQPPLFTLQHSPLMIVVYRCFTTAIVHASTLSTHYCGLPMFYKRHSSRFNTLHSSLWFTDV